ncbi:MAG TPA: Cache 3/Cache 2 fusion domain-containing protein [Terriglobia bacterium]
MFFWIYNYPASEIGALFAFVFVGITYLGIFLFQRFFHSRVHGKRSINDMVGLALSSLSVLYGLLLGLIAVAAYQNYSSVSDLVTKEASSLAALYSDLEGYPQPIRSRLQGELRDYTRYVIDESWPEQQRGMVPSETAHRTAIFVNDILSFEPSDKRSETIVHTEALRQLNNMLELQRNRLANVTSGLPGILWAVVAIGAMLSILLIVILDLEVQVNLLLGGVLSCFLGLTIFLIAEMDNPFRGGFSVGADPFQLVFDTVIKPNETVNKSMATLISSLKNLGSPKVEGKDPVAGKEVPGLYFGTTRLNNSFDIVDDVVKQFGGTASIFVKSGDEYVRVATNVKKDDGSRAIGTSLDPNGPAIARIRNGEAFYGEATILDKPYVTGYEPIRDASGNVIGIYYTGYMKQ